MLFQRRPTYLFSLAKIINRYSEMVKSKDSGEMSGTVKSNQCIPMRMLIMKTTYSNRAAKIRNV